MASRLRCGAARAREGSGVRARWRGPTQGRRVRGARQQGQRLRGSLRASSWRCGQPGPGRRTLPPHLALAGCCCLVVRGARALLCHRLLCRRERRQHLVVPRPRHGLEVVLPAAAAAAAAVGLAAAAGRRRPLLGHVLAQRAVPHVRGAVVVLKLQLLGRRRPLGLRRRGLRLDRRDFSLELGEGVARGVGRRGDLDRRRRCGQRAPPAGRARVRACAGRRGRARGSCCGACDPPARPRPRPAASAPLAPIARPPPHRGAAGAAAEGAGASPAAAPAPSAAAAAPLGACSSSAASSGTSRSASQPLRPSRHTGVAPVMPPASMPAAAGARGESRGATCVGGGGGERGACGRRAAGAGVRRARGAASGECARPAAAAAGGASPLNASGP
jgi:hypothetical protein